MCDCSRVREILEAFASRAYRRPARADEVDRLMAVVDQRAKDGKSPLEALKDGRVQNRVSWVEDGVEAMDFLRRQGKNTTAPRPDLILLDLKLPKKNGHEVLTEIKHDPDLRRIPVVIMTASDDQKDINEAYNEHANCYVTKPVDLDQFMGVVRRIEDFWLTIVKLPAA